MDLKKERYLYIDNLRLLMIIFVVMIHIAVTYSGMGGWYYKEGMELDTLSTVFFGFFQSFTQAYFMGFLFLISGYFIPGAYDKKGFGKFMRDRLIRLGIPTLIYMLVINPCITYVIMGKLWPIPESFISYYTNYITTFNFIGSSGPLWFAFALLFFSFIYALVRLIIGKRPSSDKKFKPDIKNAIILILIISVCAFLIRLVQPIDTNIINMQLCFFSQYVILFIVGVKAYRYNWFSLISNKFGFNWLKAVLILGTIFWALIMLASGALNGRFDLFKGGLHWQSAAYAVWESFTAVAMSIGLITLFRERFNRQNKLIKTLSDNSFAVYVFHAPIVIYLSLRLIPITYSPLIKFSILTLISLPLCFAVSHFILRRIPLLKKVL